MENTFQTKQLSFLDTLITVHPSGSYQTELYFKPMTAPIILHYMSCHPMSTKRAVLNAEMKRAIRVSSDKETTNRSIGLIKRLFRQNGYPDTLINKAEKNNLGIAKRKTENKNKAKTTNIFMRLPYINETVARRVNGILRSSKTGLKAAWVSGPTLSSKLIRSAFTSPPCPSGQRHCHTCDSGLQGKCTRKNVVYQITCRFCEQKKQKEVYIGECTRPVRYRFNEHLSDARLRKPDTPLGDHIAKHHDTLSNAEINKGFRIEIIGMGKDCAEVKIMESIKIRDTKPTLNVMRSSWPLVR